MNVSELLREFESSPIPKQEIPGIIGALESIKAKLFMQLCQSDHSFPVEPEDADTLITIEEMAKRTAFTEQYCYDLIRKGEIPSVRAGKYVRIRESELSLWIESHTERKQVDKHIYKLYSNSHGRKRTSQNQKVNRSNSSAVGRVDRSLIKHSSEMGAGRSENIRTFIPFHPATSGSGIGSEPQK
jgi:excisionase family DNA binding protein